MDIRYAANPRDAKNYDTAQLREEFLIDSLFAPGEIVLAYSHVDRMITGSACPQGSPLSLEAGKELSVDFFLQRREMVILNIGETGTIKAGNKEYTLQKEDALYVGTGTDPISFAGEGAKFYLLSCPAHTAYPTTLITLAMAVKTHLGSKKDANERTVNKYLDPSVATTCQLSMGVTKLEEGCVWNTMPAHTHERRMEVYLYIDLPEDAFVLHLMGTPQETRHIAMRREQAVISPSWSIHSGVGTTNYTLVWGMCGENKTYDDMDFVPMRDFR